MTSLWLSLYAGFLLALPVVIWQAWAFFLPAFDKSHERLLRIFVLIATLMLGIGVAFGYWVALPKASHFLANYDKSQYQSFIRARDYIGFSAKVLVAMAIVFELPLFVIGLTRIGIVQTRTLRRSRRIGYFVVCCVGVLLPGVDPVTTIIETVPLLVLYEASIWASVLLERRADRRASVSRRHVTSAVSADWVVPVDGPPVEGGLVRFEDGRIVEVGAGRADRHFDGAVIVPGFVNAHTHLEYANYAGFGDGLPFGPWIKTHIARKDRLRPEDMLAIARLGALESLRSGVTAVADYSFAGAAAAAAEELGLRAIVYLEVFAVDPASAERQWAEKRARVEESPLVRIGVSPHAPYTCSLDTYRFCLSLGVPVGTHLAESANETEWLLHGSGPLEEIAPLLVTPPGRRPVDALEPVLCPELLCAHCVDVDDGEIALLAARDVPVAHCPRSNALLGCGVAPLTRLRAAGVRVGIGTDSPASTPSFDMFEELRAAIYAARATERRADALGAGDALALATIGAARALRLDAEVGTLTPGKRADLTVVSLAGSPYHPVEDPAAAVVFGGSPDRVLETIVDGQTRYRKAEETQWREVRSIASAARARMLGSPQPPPR